MPPFRTLLLLILTAACGCSRVGPSFVEPRAVHVDASAFDESRLIPYRTLVPADFKARRPPAAFAGDHVDAITAALVRTACCSITLSTRAGSAVVEARVDDLRFEARMSQNHSWWNPDRPATAQALEHEQVHFALAELTARRANARIEEIRSRIQSRGGTESAAVCAARDRLRHELDRLQEDLAALHTEFDRDSMNGRRADCNHRWYRRVCSELEQSAPPDPRALISAQRATF